MNNIHDEAAPAFALAERMRFSGDCDLHDHDGDHRMTEYISHHMAQSNLRISSSLTPGIFEILRSTASQMRLSPDYIHAYVYSSPDIQAACASNDQVSCLIRISSGVINLMSSEELPFVLGHEIGHFLFGHRGSRDPQNESAEYFIQQRNQEISADRMGLIACQDLKVAVRALMKTASGLGDNFLRFDVGMLLGQMRRKEGMPLLFDDQASHPSLLMRCRALLWFSMSDVYLEATGGGDGDPISAIDKQIIRDLETYVDGPARRRIRDAREDTLLWLAVLAAIRDGTFSKIEQNLVKGLVGENTLNKLLGLFSGCSRQQVEDMTRDRLGDAVSQYAGMAPQDFRANYRAFQERVGSDFKQPDFLSYLGKIISPP